MNHNEFGDVVLNAIAFVLVVSLEHWIIASLLWGAIGCFTCYAINDQAKSNAGAVVSGLLAYAFGALFAFGVFAAALATIKTIWLAV